MQNIELSIPTPCHEDWNKMSPSQQGRFCNACAKQVIDFSLMSDTEVLNYFTRVKDENVCGRAMPDQLERTIQMPNGTTKKLKWYWNYAAAFLLLFAKSGGVKAQGGIKLKVSSQTPSVRNGDGLMQRMPLAALRDQSIIVGKMIDRNVAVILDKSVRGTITGEGGLPVPFASIIVSETSQGFTTDSLGKFVLPPAAIGKTVSVSAIGYNGVSVRLTNLYEQIVLKRESTVLKEVIIAGYSESRLHGRLGGISYGVRCTRVKDSLVKRITNINPSVSIFPNPVQKGNMLHATISFKKEGRYSMQIIDGSGRIVFHEAIISNAKNISKEIIAEKTWGSGIFIIRIAGDNNKLVQTARFILL